MSKTEKVLAANLKNLTYNILKNFNDDAVKNKTFPELANCTECDKKIFARPNKAFTTLLCGHVYHRICIKKKLLLGKQLMCPTSKCEKSVKILEEFTTAETGLRCDSESSTSSLVEKMGKDKSIVMVEGSQKRPIEVDTEETNTMQDKSPIKKAKKEVKNEDSQMLKRLIK
ncbi:3118_t:CDS:2, partial [Diversispora eburnea]